MDKFQFSLKVKGPKTNLIKKLNLVSILRGTKLLHFKRGFGKFGFNFERDHFLERLL